MPIRKELRHLYAGPEWKQARARVLRRAGNRCEFCGRPNKKFVLVTLNGQWWDETGGCWRDREGKPCHPTLRGLARRIKVVLQCAHLNHDPADHSQLAALCGRCHLAFDKAMHTESRQKRKDQRRPLLRLLGDELP